MSTEIIERLQENAKNAKIWTIAIGDDKVLLPNNTW